MSKNPASLLSAIFYVAFFGLWITGCVHSFQKHKDDPGWIQDSPLVIYRGAEFFWHNDFAGVNWDDRIRDDISTVIALMNTSTTTHDIDDTKRQVEEFGKKMNSYPEDKKTKIKAGVKVFIEFRTNLSEDFVNYLSNYNGERFRLSEDSKLLLNSLNEKFEIVSIQKIESLMDSISQKLNRDIEQLELFRQRTIARNEYDNEAFKKVYYRIFKEDIK